MIDFNSRSRLADRLNHLIDGPIDATAADSQRRDYLGASIVGHACERVVQYQYMASRGELDRPAPPAARILRIFDRGHLYEDQARRWLKDAGFLFGTPPKGLAFEDFDGKFRGHVDGVLTGWKLEHVGVASPIPLPALWENKCLGAKGWKKLRDDKLREYSSTYFAQVQIYMHYLDLPRCLFTAVNADTMEIHHELVEYDATEAALSIARVAGIIEATAEGRLVGRCSNDKNFFQCRWCDYREICFAQ